MKTWFRILAWAGGIIGVISLILYLFVYDVWTVPTDDPMMSASIEPSLSGGDVVLVTRHTTPARGNLLRCADPQAAGRFVIARMIGKWGDQIDIANEIVSIDGQHTPSPRACNPPTTMMKHPATGEDIELSCSIEEFGEMSFSVYRARDRAEPKSSAKVAQNTVYLVSDNRHMHVDSRDYGQIDPSTCQHIVFRLWGAGGIFESRHRFSLIW
jgi:signal peptidase I